MKILRVLDKNFSETVKETIKTIKEGGLVVFPTDTVYGILCDATNKRAVARLFKIKKRPRAKPVPIFTKSLQAAKKMAKINKNQESFLKKVWPGKVTAVLKRDGNRKVYGIAKSTIALRVPCHELVSALLEKTNLPLTGTSSNISGQPASTRIKEILQQFQSQKHQPDLIIDAGNLKPAKPSTIIDLTGSESKTLRK